MAQALQRQQPVMQQQHHPVRVGAPRNLRAPPAPGQGSAPFLLQRSDDDFLASTFAQLRDADGAAMLKGLVAGQRNKSGVLKLFQPVQRQFHLALIEAWCDTPGLPRLDPKRIASAGFVIRRLRSDSHGAWLEGWMSRRGVLQGWARVERLGAAGADPNMQLRLPAPRLGAALDRAFTQLALEPADAWLEEKTHPLFLAPPDVCAAAAKTLYCGIVPTSSGELAAMPAPESETFGDNFGADSADFINHLVEPLRGEAMDFPFAGNALKTAWVDALGEPGGIQPQGISNADWAVLGANPGNLAMKRFVTLLRQLASEFDAFGTSPASAAVYGRLQAIQLPLKRKDGETTDRFVDAGSFLRAAVRQVIERDPGAPAPEMPRAWPALSDADKRALRSALSSAMRARFATVKGAPGRYDEPGAKYIVHAFVRLKPEGTCPARTVWAEPSEPFVIAPWYEGAGAPPVQIAMPDPTDRGFLAGLKPNVSFVVPPSLQNLMSGNPKDMLDGKGSTGNLTLGWICSFNIPIITICAFISLNIFLSLFDLFFRWMLFIKICIPFPKRSDGNG